MEKQEERVSGMIYKFFGLTEEDIAVMEER
jgi:hypothetical protein